METYNKVAVAETEALEEDKKATAAFVKSLDGRMGFAKNTYGAFHLSLIRWMSGDDEEELLTDAKHAQCEAPMGWSLAHTCFWAVFGIIMQWVTMFLINAYMNGVSNDVYQNLNHEYFTKAENGEHANIVNATAMVRQALEQHRPLSTFTGTGAAAYNVMMYCKKDSTVPWTLELFMWIMGVGFVRQIVHLSQQCYVHLLLVKRDEDEDVEEHDIRYWQKDDQDSLGKKRLIVHTSRLTDICVILMVKIPQLLTLAFVYFVGAEMLCTAGSLKMVVLKCLGVALIGKLPGTVFKLFVEESIAGMTGKARIAFPQEKHNGLWCWWLFGKPILFVAVTAIISIAFIELRHSEVNRLRAACYSYGYAFELPSCIDKWPCGDTIFGHPFYSR